MSQENQSQTASDLKKKEMMIQVLFVPFPILAGLAIYSISYPGNYVLLPFLADKNYAYAAAAIGIIGCIVETILLLPIFKARSDLNKSQE